MMRLIYRTFFLFTWLIVVPGYLQASVYDENQVKVAFLYNFPKFIELPGETTLTLCIVGDDPFGDAINALQGSVTAGKRLVVKRITSGDTIPSCQILFISSSEQDNLEPIMKYVRKKQILTVGDTPGYPDQGVIVNFYRENNRVKIEINIDAAEQSKLKISSKLLNLARIIRDKQ
jgi:hypothetical protein